MVPSVEQSLASLRNAKVLSKIDANAGYWQILLSPESTKLTTFIMPMGQYYFKPLPFGITSAPEVFQERISQMLDDIEGVACLMDNILVSGANLQEHNERLNAVLSRLQEAGVTLTKEKCWFTQDEVRFLGHVISADVISSNPRKTEATLVVEERVNKELRKFLGMVNYHGRFVGNLSRLQSCCEC